MILEEYERAIQGLIDQFRGAEISLPEVDRFAGKLRRLYETDSGMYLGTAMKCYKDAVARCGLEGNRTLRNLVPVQIMSAMAARVGR